MSEETLQEREDKPQTETRPVVQQVVEVVEDADEIPVAEETASQHEEENVSQQFEEPEKRKEIVEELYAPRKEPMVMPEISMHKNKSMHPLIVWAMVTIIVALLSGGVLFVFTKKMVPLPSFSAKPTPTATLAPKPVATPTPAAVDKSAITIQVLNGGGTPGAASKMKKFLEDKGYTVSSTGNTDKYTYDTTEIHGKSTMTDAIAALKADLKDDYALGAVAADLPASSAADAQVIVGKE